jgi:hypothetical protein
MNHFKKNQFFSARKGRDVENQSKIDANSKQEVVSITYEEIGLFPRSFSRVLDRFLKQVFSEVENLVIQEYRFYRYLFLTTLKCVLILFLVPFLVNFFAKNYVVRPLTEYFWNSKQTEIFLNTYQQKRAFSELKDFEEKLYFESLILPKHKDLHNDVSQNTFSKNNNLNFVLNKSSKQNDILQKKENILTEENIPNSKEIHITHQMNKSESYYLLNQSLNMGLEEIPIISNMDSLRSRQTHTIKNRLQEKTIELAVRYNSQSIEAITNFFADLISFLTLFYLLFALEIQINITKSFLLEVFFGLDDSKKSLLILLVTDLLVGYHSSNIWELFFEFLFNHYGLPESQTGIFLLVATLPVLLDVLFKYLIFRHLNRSSPATVATYHAMIE